MTIVKREGFPDAELIPIESIELKVINQVPRDLAGWKIEVLPDLISKELTGEGCFNPRGLAGRHITVLVGDKEDDKRQQFK